MSKRFRMISKWAGVSEDHSRSYGIRNFSPFFLISPREAVQVAIHMCFRKDSTSCGKLEFSQFKHSPKLPTSLSVHLVNKYLSSSYNGPSPKGLLSWEPDWQESCCQEAQEQSELEAEGAVRVSNTWSGARDLPWGGDIKGEDWGTHRRKPGKEGVRTKSWAQWLQCGEWGNRTQRGWQGQSRQGPWGMFWVLCIIVKALGRPWKVMNMTRLHFDTMIMD